MLDKKGQLLTKSVNFLPAEEIDANVKFEVRKLVEFFCICCVHLLLLLHTLTADVGG